VNNMGQGLPLREKIALKHSKKQQKPTPKKRGRPPKVKEETVVEEE